MSELTAEVNAGAGQVEAEPDRPPEEQVQEGVAAAAAAREAVMAELGRRIVGQKGVIELMLVGLVSRGHCLLVGVPGLAKTLLVQSLAEVLDLGRGSSEEFEATESKIRHRLIEAKGHEEGS